MALENKIEKAVKILKEGGTLIYPTETCYGIGCDATHIKAVENIYKLKKRDTNKKLTCIVDSIETAEKYCVLTELERYICERFMPGPLTIVAEKKETIPDVVNQEFAFRVSSDKICRKLSKGLGKPLIATSANISGNESSYSVENISEELVKKADFVIDTGTLERNSPSTITSFKDGKLEVFREGPISKKDIAMEVKRFKNG